MRRLYVCLLALVCAVIALGVGSMLPCLVFAGEGIEDYAGEKKASPNSPSSTIGI